MNIPNELNEPNMNSEQTGVPIREYAEAHGLKVDAVRMRLNRGQLAGYKDGRSWFVTDGAPPTARTPNKQRTEPNEQNELIEQLRSEVAFLRAELEARRSADREMRFIIGKLEERLALPAQASQGTPESTQSAASTEAHAHATTPANAAPTKPQRGRWDPRGWFDR